MNEQLPQCVQDLRHGMRKVNIEARVLETSAPLTVQTRYGNSAKLTNAWIADETGKIKLCLWNDQAESVTAGKTVQVKNAQVYTFKGERQLCLGRIGTVNVLQNQIDEMKEKPEYAARNTIYA
jgi:replication factor A1